MSYINNSIYSSYPNYGQQQQYAQNFGMVNPQPSQQFAGVLTPETLADPSKEPGLMETIFNPFSLVFLPLMLSDHSVKNHIRNIVTDNGYSIKKTGKLFTNPLTKKPIYAWADCQKVAGVTQKITTSNLFSSIKNINYKNIWKTSVVDVHNKELYTSLAKQAGGEAKTSAKAINTILGGTHNETAIAEAIKGVKGGGKFMNGVREVLGTGTVGKFARRIPIASTILFGAMEIPEIMAASKYGTGETIKQVGKSALTVGGDVVAFSAGTSAGASIGATIGTAVFPGLGTIIGGAIGGLVGGLAASHVSRKVIGGAYEMIFGKAKHKEAEKEEALLAQQQAAQQTQESQAVQPAAFGSYTQPQQQAAPQFQGSYPPPVTANISLGDENMFSNMNSAYNMYQMAS